MILNKTARKRKQISVANKLTSFALRGLTVLVNLAELFILPKHARNAIFCKIEHFVLFWLLPKALR